MPDDPEEGFTVRDRRRFTADTPPAAAPVPPSLADEVSSTFAAPGSSALMAPGDEDEDEVGMDDPSLLGGMGEESGELPDIYSVLALFLGELRNLAWLRMGLVANPATGQIERDLAQAKIAIDTVGFLAGQLDAVVAPEERLPLKALVSDLQVNFLEQSKRG